MVGVGAAPEQTRARPVLVGLAVLGVCAIAAWCALLAFINELPDSLNESVPPPWRPLVPLGIASVVAAYAIKKSGLLVLAGRVHGSASGAASVGWWCFVARFRLSLLALLASLVAGWFMRFEVLTWLVAPCFENWGVAPNLSVIYFGSQAEVWSAWGLIVVSCSWLPAPFIASDVWLLLLPLMNARAARLWLPFVLASGLAALGAVLVGHHLAWSAFQMFAPLTGIQL